MFGVDTTEFIIVAIAALIFIGPKDLPAAMRTAGRWIGKVRGMARHFHTGVEAMIREAELEEMEKKWQAHNAAIMEQDAHNSASANAAAPAMEPLPPAAQSELPPEPVMPEQVAEPAAPAEAKPEGPA